MTFREMFVLFCICCIHISTFIRYLDIQLSDMIELKEQTTEGLETGSCPYVYRRLALSDVTRGGRSCCALFIYC